jgi:ABC-type enterobactin transport system permease subunit
MFDVLCVDGTAPVVSAFLDGVMTAFMSLGLEFYCGGSRLLPDIVTHVVGAFWGTMRSSVLWGNDANERTKAAFEGGIATLHMYSTVSGSHPAASSAHATEVA